MADDEIEAKAYPPLNLPKSESCCEVHIIDTTTNLVVPAWAFVAPIHKGQESMNMPTFAFLIENRKLNKKTMFDLGCRKDWWNLAPAAKGAIKEGISALEVPKNINEILHDGGVDDKDIDGIVWSHWHFDHTGDPSLFPESAELWVGPGFKENFMPAFPKSEESPVLESDFKGRAVNEISFDSNQKIGQYPSYDFFGDGSFYLLDVPGHAVGHIAGLARTTHDTFILMGGDVCHFGGSYRPTEYAPLPSEIPSTTPLDSHYKTPCPCSIFQAVHKDPENFRTSPFYSVTQDPKGWYLDSKVAQTSVDRLAEFDADPNIFICIAHDGGLIPVVDWFPKGNLNQWKERGWKEMSKWGFVNELPVNGKPGRPWIAPGLVKDGKVLSKDDVADV